MILFQTKGTATVHNDKTNLIHRFDVPGGIEEIKISYSYSPKTVEDREKAIEYVKACFEKYDENIITRPGDYLPVNNLITLSLDDPNGYRGAAHRQDNEQVHIINSDFASPGFYKGEIEEGEWSVVLNAHYIGCDVSYQITIEGFDKKGGNE